MTDSQHDFVVSHYAPRASAYVTSAVHSGGADLDAIASALEGCGTARVLDLGCGGGHVSYRAAPLVREVVACDLTPDMLAEVEQTAAERGLRNITTVRAPAERLPFEDASFDVILCRFTVHHWQDAEAGLREARRVLKDDGWATFIDVVSPPRPAFDTHLQALELLRDPSHVRNYRVAEWLAMLGRAGFIPKSLTSRKLRMDFEPWTRRTRTSAAHVAALLSLQTGASEAVKRHFDVAEDGSFDLDSVTFEVVPAEGSAIA